MLKILQHVALNPLFLYHNITVRKSRCLKKRAASPRVDTTGRNQLQETITRIALLRFSR